MVTGALLLASPTTRFSKAPHGRQLALLPWAFAEAGLYDAALFQEVAECLKGQPHVVTLIEGSQLLGLIWAYRRARHKDGALLHVLSRRLTTQVGDCLGLPALIRLVSAHRGIFAGARPSRLA